MRVDKEFRPLVKRLEALGYTVEQKGGKHPKVLRPDGTFVCPLPSSCSDHRGLQRKITELRQRGVPV